MLPHTGRLSVFGAHPIRVDAVNPLARTTASLAITANIYFGDQDEEAFAVETDFYLLDQSLIEILKTARFTPEFPDGEERPSPMRIIWKPSPKPLPPKMMRKLK